jgi:hypothetical protein
MAKGKSPRPNGVAIKWSTQHLGTSLEKIISTWLTLRWRMVNYQRCEQRYDQPPL